MSEPVDLLATPWRHVRLPIPPGHPVDGPPPLAKVWLPPVPGTTTGPGPDTGDGLHEN
jgi:hypothetical protein